MEEFQKETKLHDDLFIKIRQFLINNYLELYKKVDEEALLEELPASLREEVLYKQYGPLVEKIKILNDSDDNEFVWALVQLAQKISFGKDDTIYWQNDFSESFFMIYEGKVQLFAQNGHAFTHYIQGDLVGDSDALLGEARDSKAMAQIQTETYSLKVESLETILVQFPETHAKMVK